MDSTRPTITGQRARRLARLAAISPAIAALTWGATGAAAATVSPPSGLLIPSPTNPGPELSVKTDTPVAPLSPQLAAQLASKSSGALSLFQLLGSTTDRYANSAMLVANQQPQTTSYYCGPASVVEAITAMGIAPSGPGTTPQDQAAYYLGTTGAGSPWYGYNSGMGPRVPNSTGYPMVDTLNWYVQGSGTGYYTPQAVAYNPTDSDYASYQANLAYDIHYGWPVVGDAWEVPGGPHLVGHPNVTIFHWFEIRGYTASGANTAYEDSVSGSPYISWSASVPPYSTLTSRTITQIVGGRGYVW